MASVEIHLDDTSFAYGIHRRGNSSPSLIDPTANFLSWGVAADMLLKNTTDGSEGVITAVTEHTVTATLSGGTGNDWDYEDEYEIYRSGTEDSYVSKIFTDRSRGWKVTNPNQLNENGWFPEDADLDEDDEHVWSPGFPE